MGFRKALLLLSMVLSSFGCQKLNPEVYSLGSGATQSPIDTAANPANGRVTLGSDEHILSSGNYKLKGRIATAATEPSSAGSYKLRGTVRF